MGDRTRSDPATSVDILRRTWSGPLDPIIQPGQKGHNSRMIIEAVRPWEWRDKFPATSAISDETRSEYSKKWEKNWPRCRRATPRTRARTSDLLRLTVFFL